jgi:hypothetical protein
MQKYKQTEQKKVHEELKSFRVSEDLRIQE